MQLLSFNSKKYYLTIFMSISLLAWSFLSTEARAASFSDLVREMPSWKKYKEREQKKIWNDFTPYEKILKWKEVGLVPSIDQVKDDLGIKLSFIPNKHEERLKKAEIQLYLQQIEQQDYYKKFNEFVRESKIPDDQEVAAMFNFQYDASLTNKNINSKIRRPEKDKKALIDLYSSLINREIKYKNYVDQNIIPEMEYVRTALGITKDEAEFFVSSVRTDIMNKEKTKYIDGNNIPTKKELEDRFGKSRDDDRDGYLKEIRREVMDTKKAEYITNNTIPTEKELKDKFGADKNEVKNYTASIATQLMLNEKESYIANYIANNTIPTEKELKEKYKIGTVKAKIFIDQIKAGKEANDLLKDPKLSVNHHQKNKIGLGNGDSYISNQTENNSVIFNKAVIETGRKVKKQKSFNLNNSLNDVLNGINESELPQFALDLKRDMELKEKQGEFREALERNPLEALKFANRQNLDNFFKGEAATAIINNLDNNKLAEILFDKDNLELLLSNCSNEQREQVIQNSRTYAVQTFPTAMSNNKFNPEQKLIIATLTSMKDKKVLEEALKKMLSKTGYKNEIELKKLFTILLSDKDALKDKENKIFKLKLTVANDQNQSGIPIPPPPPPPFGNNNNNGSLNLEALRAKYPELYKLYDKFIQDRVKANENKPTPRNTTSTYSERAEPESRYGRKYIAYRIETNEKKASDLQDQKITKKRDLANVIRQIITEEYSNENNVDFQTLVNLFSAENEQIKQKAKEVFKELVSDPYIKDIITDGNKTTITRSAIIDNLFKEKEEDALTRLSLPISGITEVQRKNIKDYQIKIALEDEFAKIKDPLVQLQFANKNADVLGNNVFNDTLNQLVDDHNKLNTAQQIRFIVQEHANLTKEIPLAKTALDQLKQSILNEIEIKQLLKNKKITQQNLSNIIKDKNPELLPKLYEALVTKESNKSNPTIQSTKLDEYLKALGFDEKLYERLSPEAIEARLKELWEEKNTANKNISEVGGIPIPPPPPPIGGFGNLQYPHLTGMGVPQSVIDMKKNLQKHKTFSFRNNNRKVDDFDSDIGQECHALISKLIGPDMLLSPMQKIEKVIKTKVLQNYVKEDPNRKVNLEDLKQAFEEEFNFDLNSIGPKDEEGQKIYEHYELVSLKLAEDQKFLKYLEENKNIKETEKIIIKEFLSNALTKKVNPSIIYSDDSDYGSDYDESSDLPSPTPSSGSNLEHAYRAAITTTTPGSSGTSATVTAATGVELKEAESLKEMVSMFEKAEEAAEAATAAATAAADAELKEAEGLEGMVSMFEKAEEEAEAAASSNGSSSTAAPAAASSNGSSSTAAPAAATATSTATGGSATASESQELGEHKDEEILDGSYENEEEVEIDNQTGNVSINPESSEEQEDLNAAESDQNKAYIVAVLLRKLTANCQQPVHWIFTQRIDSGAPASAGDEDRNVTRGVWISGLYGTSSQGAWKNIPKYKGRTAGVTIGVDKEFSDSSDIIGIAYSRIESHFKYNKKLGKTSLNGHLISAYGLKELPKNFSLQGIASFGHNYIKNKTKNANNIVGKYKNNNINFETLLSYKHRIKYDTYLIPSIGLKYDYLRNGNYKEANNIQNLMIEKKSNQLLEGSFGGKIVFNLLKVSNDITLTPSLHGNLESHFYNKNAKVKTREIFKDQVIEDIIKLPKQPKVGYNIGGNLLFARRNINILLEHNYYTHKKYQSHQSLIKLKVNL